MQQHLILAQSKGTGVLGNRRARTMLVDDETFQDPPIPHSGKDFTAEAHVPVPEEVSTGEDSAYSDMRAVMRWVVDDIDRARPILNGVENEEWWKKQTLKMTRR